MTTPNKKDPSFSQTNKSPTKQQYSFAKAHKLELVNKPYCVSTYDIPNTLNKRSAAIGRGNRTNRMISYSPAPGQYEQIDGTLQWMTRKRGYTIGVGRDQAQSQGIIATFKTDSPGVGSYAAKTTLSQISYTIPTKPKSGGISDMFSKNGVPGPGKYYNLPRFNAEGKYIQSQVKNIRSIVFNKQGGSRFTGNGNEKVPGPGSYKTELRAKDGKYNLSTNKNPRFPIIARFAIANSRLPRSESLGPGSYNLPSEFGDIAAQYSNQK